MPVRKAEKKIEKSQELLLKLQRTPDILFEVGKRKNRPFIIGFAAETGGKIERAREKLKGKNMDMIVLNDVSVPGSGFDSDTNKVVIIDREEETELPFMSKDSVADAILDRYNKLRS